MKLYLACADFPYLWPTPKPAVNTVHRGKLYPSRIELPVVPERDNPLIVIPPSSYDLGAAREVRPGWRVERDQKSVSVEWGGLGWRVTMTALDVGQPAEMVLDAVRRMSVPTPKGTIDTEGRIRIRSDAQTFHTELNVNIVWGGEPHFHREWKTDYARRLR